MKKVKVYKIMNLITCIINQKQGCAFKIRITGRQYCSYGGFDLMRSKSLNNTYNIFIKNFKPNRQIYYVFSKGYHFLFSQTLENKKKMLTTLNSKQFYVFCAQTRSLGAKEITQIAEEFHVSLRLFNPDFKKEWYENITFDLDFVSGPSLGNIHKFILYYPTVNLLLTNSFPLSELKREDIYPSPSSKFPCIYLINIHEVSKIQLLIKNFDIVKEYYRKLFSLFLNEEVSPLFFSYRCASSLIFGTEYYLSSLNNWLNTFIKTTKERKDIKKIATKVRHGESKALFLIPGYKSFARPPSYPLPADQLSLFDCPIEIVAFLSFDRYESFSYKEDLLDLINQFLDLNNIDWKQMWSLREFKDAYHKKGELLEYWSSEYGVEQKFIIFCLEQYIRGTLDEVYRPLKELLKLEAQKRNPYTNKMSILNYLISLKFGLNTVSYSFRYRRCPLVDALLEGHIEFLITDEMSPVLSIFDLLQNHLGIIAPYGVLSSYDKKVYTCLFEEFSKVEFPPSDEEVGLPGSDHRQMVINFSNIILIVEKQIQKAFFQVLLELFPTLVINHSVERIYDLFFLDNDNKTFFVPKEAITLTGLESDAIFDYLQKRIKDKTGYVVTLFPLDLVMLKTDLEQQLFCNKQNVQPHVPEVIIQQNTDINVFKESKQSDLHKICKNLTEDLPFVHDIVASEKKYDGQSKFFKICFDGSINKNYLLSDKDLYRFFEDLYSYLTLNEVKKLIDLVNIQLKTLGFLRKRTRVASTEQDILKQTPLSSTESSKRLYAFHNICLKDSKKT